MLLEPSHQGIKLPTLSGLFQRGKGLQWAVFRHKQEGFGPCKPGLCPVPREVVTCRCFPVHAWPKAQEMGAAIAALPGVGEARPCSAKPWGFVLGAGHPLGDKTPAWTGLRAAPALAQHQIFAGPRAGCDLASPRGAGCGYLIKTRKN